MNRSAKEIRVTCNEKRRQNCKNISGIIWVLSEVGIFVFREQ